MSITSCSELARKLLSSDRLKLLKYPKFCQVYFVSSLFCPMVIDKKRVLQLWMLRCQCFSSPLVYWEKIKLDKLLTSFSRQVQFLKLKVLDSSMTAYLTNIKLSLNWSRTNPLTYYAPLSVRMKLFPLFPLFSQSINFRTMSHIPAASMK